ALTRSAARWSLRPGVRCAPPCPLATSGTAGLWSLPGGPRPPNDSSSRRAWSDGICRLFPTILDLGFDDDESFSPARHGKRLCPQILRDGPIGRGGPARMKQYGAPGAGAEATGPEPT